ncbi:unnamed protein product [Hermetia illucens]|uniref:Endothelin-converting enzyme 1 n=2 Tax=Hermetia illucens TaxID=343691 RepID=A0A7R8UGM0_HERIL|nr:unnamed protein product [Hermetia illucens]
MVALKCLVIWTVILISYISAIYSSPVQSENTENHVYDPANYMNNFQTLRQFWKGEGTFEEIRHAQGEVMKKFMDPTVDPCEDFYSYACGNWDKFNPVPEDEGDFSMFTIVYNNLNDILRDSLMEDILEDTTEDDAMNKAKNFYRSCMNLDVLKQRGLQPLMQFVEDYGGWPALHSKQDESDYDWVNITAHFSLLGRNILLHTSVTEDLKNSNENIIYFYEPMLGLQNRDDYLLESNALHLAAYRNFTETVLTLLGVAPEEAAKTAKEIVDFEIQLAKIQTDQKSRPDIREMYQRTTVGQFEQKHPTINLTKYLSIVQEKTITVEQPIVLLTEKYIDYLLELLAATDNRTIANYIMFRGTKELLPYLDDRFSQSMLKLDEALTGQRISAPRWKDCVKETNDQMGMAVSAIFVRKYFDETSKKEVTEMTNNLRKAFQDILTDATWIDEETKKVAMKKAEAIRLEVGYPEFILNSKSLNAEYEGISIHPEQYFENSLNLVRHEVRIERQKLNHQVNKNEWPMPPSVVNAFFEQTKNRIIIPAGILQLPFYHHHFPKSLKYGGIGILIGHELTHGFDDRGRNFDLEGNMENWWTDDSIKSFKESAQCFVTQYNNYSYNGKNLYGASSQGENIADNGGMRQSFYAYRKWLKQNEDSDEMKYETFPQINLTNTQLFFLTFAQTWCSSIRPEAVETFVGTNRHCPGKYRAIGTLSNFDEFAKEFNCPAGSPMNPTRKCKIW